MRFIRFGMCNPFNCSTKFFKYFAISTTSHRQTFIKIEFTLPVKPKLIIHVVFRRQW